MKLVTFEVDTSFGTQRRLGVLIDGEVDGRIADLTLSYATYLREETDETMPDELAQLRTPPNLIGWLRGGHKSRKAADRALAFIKEKTKVRTFPFVFARDQVKLLSPLPRPNTFRDFSIYEEHGSKRDGDDAASRRHKPPNWFRWPPYYKGNPESIFGPEDPIPYPYYSKKLDLEAEIGIVIGQTGRNLTFEQARTAIAGYTIIIDCSDRGAGKRDTLGPAKSKDFATMVGPCFVTADEIDENDMRVRVSVDGELWFDGNTNLPHSFSFNQIVAYASDNETLMPGDLIGTGTIGASASNDLHKWPQVGQTMTIEVEGIGRMRHKIVAGEKVVNYVGGGMEGMLKPAN